MSKRNRNKALRNQPTVKKEIAEKKNNAINENKNKYNRVLAFTELFVVVLLISLGASAVVLGLQSIHFPCAGNLCGEIATAGAVTLTIGLILLFVAAQIIIWINAFKD